MADHAKAFDKGTDEDKLKATSDQYKEKTGQADAPEDGPDPIVEAIQKQADETDTEDKDVPDPVYINPEYEEAHAKLTEELESKSRDPHDVDEDEDKPKNATTEEVKSREQTVPKSESKTTSSTTGTKS